MSEQAVAMREAQSYHDRHFYLHSVAVISRLLQWQAQGDLSSDILQQYPFLEHYRQQTEQLPDWQSEILDIEAEVANPLPLQLLREFDDERFDLPLLLVAIGIIEEDVRFGSLFALLQAPLQSRRPCLGLLDWLLNPIGQASLDVGALGRRLQTLGLVELENESDARSEWVLRMPVAIWDMLRGQFDTHTVAGLIWQSALSFPQSEHLIVDDTLQAQIRNTITLAQHAQVDTILLRGMVGSGRRTVAGSMAQALEKNVLLCDMAQVPKEQHHFIKALALLGNAMPVLRFDLSPSETTALPDLTGFDLPIAITLGRIGGIRLSSKRSQKALTLNIPIPNRAARHAFWQQSIGHFSSHVLEAVSERFLLTGGYIHRASALAKTLAAVDGRDEIVADDVQNALGSMNRQSLDTLATHLNSVDGWQSLIVNDLTQAELLALEMRCRAREALQTVAGRAFANNLNRGVRALFGGPSGTGKTLAARALASELHMDIYRVDLASVVNKYIGETERNLNEVFSRAEELDVILLLDEGDSLMSKRTDVQSSNDRYANLETNYLLQRMENYEGILIVTSNASQRIDQAFVRRLDVVIEFELPTAFEREVLWTLHLSSQHEITPSVLDSVVNQCALTGGQIRNAALYATLLALHNDTAIQDTHYIEAVKREYRKAGADFPFQDNVNGTNQKDILRRFVTDIDNRQS